jgi:hypothetical protein
MEKVKFFSWQEFVTAIENNSNNKLKTFAWVLIKLLKIVLHHPSFSFFIYLLRKKNP